MNLFELVFKQMRQRALSTWLTMLSVLLGVALAIAIVILYRESEALFGQRDYGYDVLIGAKGSPLQLTINTVYNIDQSPGNIPYTFYETLMSKREYRSNIKIAVPTAVGDSYMGRRIIGTLPKMFGFDDTGKELAGDLKLEYRAGKHFEFAQGNVFAADKFEAVIGSDITRLTGLKLGDEFQATHGLPRPDETPDIHKPKWKVVGILKPTHTAADGALYIPLISFYCIAEHDVGLVAQAAIREGNAPPPPAPKDDEHEEEHYKLREDGTIDLQLPKDVWGLSAVIVKTRAGGFTALDLMYRVNNGQIASAVNPASEMRKFFNTFLDSTAKLLLVIAALVTVVAAVGILVSIYNSVSARLREIAILRALGATRGRVLMLICIEATMIGLLGALLGLVGAHLLAGAASIYFEKTIGETIDWLAIDRWELLYLAAVVVLSAIAGLAPALKAYRVPVAGNLVAE